MLTSTHKGHSYGSVNIDIAGKVVLLPEGERATRLLKSFLRSLLQYYDSDPLCELLLIT